MEAIVRIDSGSRGDLERLVVSKDSKEMKCNETVINVGEELRNKVTNFSNIWLVISPALDV